MRCVLVSLLALSSCAPVLPARPPRALWLQNTIVEDHLLLLVRSPELVAVKFEVMARDPYSFFRGTLGQFTRDVTVPGPGYLPTRYLTREAAQLALVGDPHLENIGTYRSDLGVLSVEYNDFDAATFGPYTFDLRRLSLSFFVAGSTLGLSDEESRALARAAAQGYADQLRALSLGGAPLRLHPEDTTNPLWSDLLADAREDGEAAKELGDFTEVLDGVRRFKEGPLNVEGDALAPVSSDEEEMLRALLARYPASVLGAPGGAFLVCKDVARRFGAGVSSLPLLRYYALIEGPSAAIEDDLLLELKEVRDPPAYALELFPAVPFDDNAARAVSLARALQESPRVDPLLGHAREGGVALRVRWLTEFQEGVDLPDIAAGLLVGALTGEDLRGVAHDAGGLLARGHAFAEGLEGRGLPALLGAVNGDFPGLVDETASFVEVYGPQLLQDFLLFRALLAEEGPLLGFTPPQETP